MSVYLKLMEVQTELKAPKNQYNSFGKYNYRSCEDIMEGVKPHLSENKALLVVSDEVVYKEGRFYVKSTATFIDAETGEKVEATAEARECEEKKGMDAAQVTGSASSYARKYALNGLFAIDDTKDSDATNTHGKDSKKKDNASNPKTTSTPATKVEKVNANHIKSLHTRLTAKGISDADKKKYLQMKYNIESSKDLDIYQYNEMMDYLAKKPDKKEEAEND